MIEVIAIGFGVAGLSLYGVVRASLAFVERVEVEEDRDLCDLSDKQLRLMREQLITDHNWWSNVRGLGDDVRKREILRCIETIACVDREMIRRIGQ